MACRNPRAPAAFPSSVPGSALHLRGRRYDHDMQSAREYFDYLNHAYVAVHRTKEDLFWATYMATSDDHAAFAPAEGAYKEFIGDPAKLTKTRDELAAVRAAPP